MIEDDFGEVKLPGGGIDSGEDEYKALVREVKEEIGLDINENDISFVGSSPNTYIFKNIREVLNNII